MTLCFDRITIILLLFHRFSDQFTKMTSFSNPNKRPPVVYERFYMALGVVVKLRFYCTTITRGENGRRHGISPFFMIGPI